MLLPGTPQIRTCAHSLPAEAGDGTCTAGEHEGAVGYGMSEYLDQIIDEAPVGIAE